MWLFNGQLEILSFIPLPSPFIFSIVGATKNQWSFNPLVYCKYFSKIYCKSTVSPQKTAVNLQWSQTKKDPKRPHKIRRSKNRNPKTSLKISYDAKGLRPILFCTFNPLVVISILARPTSRNIKGLASIFILKLIPLFLGKRRFSPNLSPLF